MGVLPEHHRIGIGRAILDEAESWLAERDITYLQVKTLSPRSADEGYAATRAFYFGCGFRPLEEMPELWGADQPALQMIKTVPPSAHDRDGGRARGTDRDYLRERQYKDPATSTPALRCTPSTRGPTCPGSTGSWIRSTGPRVGRCSRSVAGQACSGPAPRPLLPRLRLTLTDLSEGMVAAASAAVARVAGHRPGRGSRLRRPGPALRRRRVRRRRGEPHAVPRPRSPSGCRRFARVLRPAGVLLAATNGPRHLDAVADVSRAALGWSSLDSVDEQFGRSTGEEILRTAFGSVTWRLHPSTMVCTDPADVLRLHCVVPRRPGRNTRSAAGARRGGRQRASPRRRTDDDHRPKPDASWPRTRPRAATRCQAD